MAVQDRDEDRAALARKLIAACIGCTTGGAVVAFTYATVDGGPPLQAGLCDLCRHRLAAMGSYTERLHAQGAA